MYLCKDAQTDPTIMVHAYRGLNKLNSKIRRVHNALESLGKKKKTFPHLAPDFGASSEIETSNMFSCIVQTICTAS